MSLEKERQEGWSERLSYLARDIEDVRCRTVAQWWRRDRNCEQYDIDRIDNVGPRCASRKESKLRDQKT